MTTDFGLSAGLLRQARTRRPGAALAAGSLILLAALIWAALAEVPLLVHSVQARVEHQGSAAGAHRVQSPLVGKVQRSPLSLGSRVQRGDLIVELDAEPLALQTRETQARLDGLARQAQHLEQRIDLERQAAGRADAAGLAQQAQASARLAAAVSAEDNARDESRRMTALRQAGMVSQSAVERADDELRRRQAERAAAAAAVDVARHDAALAARERDVRSLQWRGELAAVRAAEQAAAAQRARQHAELERHSLRAPITGRVAELRPLREGAVLLEGEHVATLIPDDDGALLQVAARFAAPEAIGRLRRGQAARFRPTGTGWPWGHSFAATLQEVGAEVRDGQVQAELLLQPDSEAAAAAVHGLEGEVAVRLESVSPWTLLTRSLGDRLARTRP